MAQVSEIAKVRPSGYKFFKHLGYWDRIMYVVCDECGKEHVDVIDTNPGSIEAAIGVRELCSECWAKPDIEPFHE